MTNSRSFSFSRAHNRNRVRGKSSEVGHVDALKRYIVNRESDSEGNFRLVKASRSERDRKDGKTSKPRQPTSLPVRIESKAGEVYRN